MRSLGFALEPVQAAGAVLRGLGRILRERVAALDDSHRHRTVEHGAVVGTCFGLVEHVADVVGGRRGVQLDDDGAERGLEDDLLVLERPGRPGRGVELRRGHRGRTPPGLGFPTRRDAQHGDREAAGHADR